MYVYTANFGALPLILISTRILSKDQNRLSSRSSLTVLKIVIFRKNPTFRFQDAFALPRIAPAASYATFFSPSSNQSPMVPEPAFCLSMDSDVRGGLYRFSTENTVFYVEAHPETDIDEEDYGFPPAILQILEPTPRPPECNWADIREHTCRVESQAIEGCDRMLAPRQSRFTRPRTP
jgi:hypothetical protein